MKSVLFIAAAALALTACGGGGGKLETACAKSMAKDAPEGINVAEACSCLSKELTENLNSDEIKLVTEMMEMDDPDSLGNNPEDAMKYMAVMEPMTAAMKECELMDGM